LNLRPSGYEPDELPDCSTPRCKRSAASRGRTAARGGSGPWSGSESWRPCGRGRARRCCLSFELWPLLGGGWTAGQTWRRPALPPLRGQYPGRGAVSRPSSEWGRVGPARCDHQVRPAVQARRSRAEISRQRTEGSSDAGDRPRCCRLARCCSWSREALGMGSADRRGHREIGRRASPGTGTTPCLLPSAFCLLERSRKRA
jgi:hypothetical protein